MTSNHSERFVYDTGSFDNDSLVAEKNIVTRAFELWDHATWPEKTKETSWKSNRDEIIQRLANGETVTPYERAVSVKDSWNPWNPAYSTLMSRYLDYTLFTAGGSAVFAMANGFLGIANHYVQKGDWVIMLDDSPRFVVLRPAGGSYEFLGFALVHGFMRGELKELSPARHAWDYTQAQFTLI